jgi:pimeloyl-ACP methyl ester carboxylesterase
MAKKVTVSKDRRLVDEPPARNMTRLLTVSLLLVLLGSFLANMIQTSGGTVQVRDVRFAGSNGLMMSGLLYIPDGVSAEAPAPGIVAIHGYINSRETQDGYAIEFSRRGYVVLATDQTGHGYSDPPAFANGFGGPDALAYMRTLNFVDKDNIGLEGHSMGGWASVIAASVIPDGYQAIMLQGSSTGTFGAPDGTPTFPRNLGLVFSKFDEFSSLMWGTDKAAAIVETDKLKTLFDTTETVQVGKLYGSIADGTGRMLYQPVTNHPGDHISRAAIGDAVDWFQQTLQGSNGLAPTDQVWFWKEFGTFVALIGMVMSLFAFGALLLRSRFFGVLRDPMPEFRGVSGPGWWLAALLTVAIPALTFFRLQHLADAPWTPTALFPQNLTTGIMFWALGNGLITLVLFLLWHFLLNRKTGADADNYGLTWRQRLNGSKIWRSFLLALAIAAFGYLQLLLVDFFFKVDFRLWVLAIKPFSPLQFRIFLSYLIPFILFFLMLSVTLTGQMRRDVKMSTAMWINIALLITGIAVMLLIQYVTLFSNGMMAIAAEPLLTIVAYQFLPLLAIVAMLITFFFRQTGRVWVGAFLCAILITWIIVAGQATHFAF